MFKKIRMVLTCVMPFAFLLLAMYSAHMGNICYTITNCTLLLITTATLYASEDFKRGNS